MSMMIKDPVTGALSPGQSGRSTGRTGQIHLWDPVGRDVDTAAKQRNTKSRGVKQPADGRTMLKSDSSPNLKPVTNAKSKAGNQVNAKSKASPNLKPVTESIPKQTTMANYKSKSSPNLEPISNAWRNTNVMGWGGAKNLGELVDNSPQGQANQMNTGGGTVVEAVKPVDAVQPVGGTTDGGTGTTAVVDPVTDPTDTTTTVTGGGTGTTGGGTTGGGTTGGSTGGGTATGGATGGGTTGPTRETMEPHVYRPSSMPNLPALANQRGAYNYEQFGFDGLPDHAGERQAHPYERFGHSNLPGIQGERDSFGYEQFGFDGLPEFHQRQGQLNDFHQRDNSGLASFDRMTQGIEGGPQSGDELTQATFDRGMNMLRPQIEQARQKLSQSLVNKGLPIGSEAYNDAMNRNDAATALQLENLALSSVGAGRQEQSRLFNILSQARGQKFGEQSRMSDEAARERGMRFGEQSRLHDEAAQRRGMTSAEQAQAYGLNLAGQGQAFNQGSRLFDESMARRGALAGEQERAYGLNLAGQGQNFDQGSRVFDESRMRRNDLSQEQMQQYAINQAAQQQNFNQQGAMLDDTLRRRNQGLNEYMISRNQPLSELAQLMAMQRGVQQPQFQPTAQYSMGSPDIMGMTQNNYMNKMNQYNQQSSDFWGGMYGLAGGALFSDRRLKQDIKPVGKLDNGLPVYVYRYKGDDVWHMGLMADEVKKVNPGAVTNVRGFDAVHYEEAVK